MSFTQAELAKSYSNPDPSGGDIYINKPLTNFMVGWMQKAMAFIATQAATTIPVEVQTGNYWELGLGSQMRDDAEERAPGTETPGVGYQLHKRTYDTIVWGTHSDLADADTVNADRQVRLERGKTRTIARSLLIRKESIFADKFMTPNKWNNGTSAKTAGNNVNWGASGSNPITDIRGAKTAVQGITGFRPNTLIVGRDAFDTLIDNEEVVARTTGMGSSDDPAMVDAMTLAALFEVDRVLVMDGVKNSANEGSPVNIGFISQGNALLCYIEPDLMSEEEPTAFVNFAWTGYVGMENDGVRITQFRMNHLKSTRIEGESAFDMKQIAAELGYLFVSVTS